jgi:hypothetical protein
VTDKYSDYTETQQDAWNKIYQSFYFGNFLFLPLPVEYFILNLHLFLSLSYESAFKKAHQHVHPGPMQLS